MLFRLSGLALSGYMSPLIAAGLRIVFYLPATGLAVEIAVLCG
jgi:hypothetical protein